jgi:hypothetical protein
MPAIQTTHVEVRLSPAPRRVEFLALRRSPDRRRHPSVWQPVTGTSSGETAFEADPRALGETGRDQRAVGLRALTPTSGREQRGEPVAGVRGRVRSGSRRLSGSDDWRFVSAAQAGRYLWEAQRRSGGAARCSRIEAGRALELDARHAKGGASRVAAPGRDSLPRRSRSDDVRAAARRGARLFSDTA